MKLTEKERNALTIFNWKIRSRTKHNWRSYKHNKDPIDLNSAQELQHILNNWEKTKKELKIRLKIMECDR